MSSKASIVFLTSASGLMDSKGQILELENTADNDIRICSMLMDVSALCCTNGSVLGKLKCKFIYIILEGKRIESRFFLDDHLYPV